jgi:uncharacterized protein
MLDEQNIIAIVRRIVTSVHPKRVILFGSYGRNDANQDSDLDIMVIKENVKNRSEEMIRLRRAVGDIGIGVDILVYSEDEVNERRDWCTSPVFWALREGKTLYAAQ